MILIPDGIPLLPTALTVYLRAGHDEKRSGWVIDIILGTDLLRAAVTPQQIGDKHF